MVARRSGAIGRNDAFELFLDTICNAFGSIIFISLLICVILQISGSTTDPEAMSPEEVARLQQRLATLQAEIDGLRVIRKAQLANLKFIEDNTDPELLKKYLTLVKQKGDLEPRYQNLLQELAGIEVKNETILRQLAALMSQLKNLGEKEGKLIEILNALRKRSGVRLRLPQLHATKKMPVPLFLHEGRLSFARRYNQVGAPLAYNETDVVVLKGAGGRVTGLRPKPGGGFVVGDRQALEAALAGELAKFTNKPTPQNGKTEKQCHYFMILLWPDSYPQFGVLRDMLVEKDFDYGLLLLKKGDPVVVTEKPPPGDPPSGPQ